MSHPCQRCGACCAAYRVAFHWSETECFPGGAVPQRLTAKLDPHRVAMRGTDGAVPRCVALRGVVGSDVACGIYAQRPSPCRELMPAGEHGRESPQCDRARARHGVPPLTALDWRAR